MWTYLAIFLSVSAILVVFFNKMIFVAKGKDLIEKNVKQVDEDPDLAANMEREKISRYNKEKIKDLIVKGDSLINAGSDDEAIKCFVQALTLNPHHIESMQKLGILYMHKQMYSVASALFKELASLEEDSVHYSHLGLALYRQNDFEEAKKAYQKSIVLDDSRPQRFVSLGQVYRELGNHNLAIIALNKAIDIDPENIDYLFLMADLLFEIDEFEQAKEVAKKILEIDSENEIALKMLRRRRSS